MDFPRLSDRGECQRRNNVAKQTGFIGQKPRLGNRVNVVVLSDVS